MHYIYLVTIYSNMYGGTDYYKNYSLHNTLLNRFVGNKIKIIGWVSNSCLSVYRLSLQSQFLKIPKKQTDTKSGKPSCTQEHPVHDKV